MEQGFESRNTLSARNIGPLVPKDIFNGRSGILFIRDKTLTPNGLYMQPSAEGENSTV